MRVLRRNRAFTLLELLIAMGLTLLLVLAIGQFYTIVVASVRDGRALIEMGSDLRNAVKQLRDDLNSVTSRMEPPGDPTNDQGCFEIIEGPANDADANADGNVDAQVSGNTAGGPMMGDLDDILTFTIRASGAPFVGRYLYYREQSQTFQVKSVESHLAEVVWFTTFKDVNGDGLYQPAEPRFLVRRMFLVAPNLPGWEEDNPANPGTTLVHYGELVDPVIADPAQYAVPNTIPWNVFQYNDVSMAAPFTPGTLTVPSGTSVAWRCNSLSTLTRRENRFVHLDLDLSNGSQNGLQNGNNWLPFPLMVNLTDLRNVPNSLLYFTLQGNKTGEDLILPNMLAFDVRVYDPQAPLLGDAPDVVGVAPDTSQTTDDAAGVVQPGDPGYFSAIAAGHQFAGYGAYVDLWYNRALAPQFVNQGIPLNNPPWPHSVFSWAPDVRCLPPAYRPPAGSFLTNNGPMVCSWDIWSTYYERDGNNQDTPADMIIDEGTNGQDDDGQNGVDDPGEYETHPPYPSWIGNNGVDDDLDGSIDEADEADPQAWPRPTGSPLLRGIQVRIRLYEVGTRQTQQATVIADFLDE